MKQQDGAEAECKDIYNCFVIILLTTASLRYHTAGA